MRTVRSASRSARAYLRPTTIVSKRRLSAEDVDALTAASHGPIVAVEDLGEPSILLLPRMAPRPIHRSPARPGSVRVLRPQSNRVRWRLACGPRSTALAFPVPGARPGEFAGAVRRLQPREVESRRDGLARWLSGRPATQEELIELMRQQFMAIKEEC